MEYIDLVNKIVTAEQSAQSIAREAQEKQENLNTDLERDLAQLREEYFARAKRRVSMVEETEQADARAAMANWDRKLTHAMGEVEASYAKNKDRWIDTLFEKIIGG